MRITYPAQSNEPIGYHVYRSTNPDVPKNQWKRITDTPVPDTNFTDSTCEPDTAYYYYVTAIYPGGVESGPSEVISARTLAKTQSS